MGYHDRSQAVIAVESLNQVKDLAGGGFVQVAGGFVGEEQPRVVDKGASQGNALLFSAGKLAGAMIAAVVEAHFTQPVSRQFYSFSSGHAACE